MLEIWAYWIDVLILTTMMICHIFFVFPEKDDQKLHSKVQNVLVEQATKYYTNRIRSIYNWSVCTIYTKKKSMEKTEFDILVN
jgi:hypothetical protein